MHRWNGLRIVDAHLHVGEDRDGSTVREDELIRLLEENHIAKGLVLPFNEQDEGRNFLVRTAKNLCLQDRYPAKVLCGFRVDPTRDFRQIVDFAQEHDIPAMKLHPTSQGFKITSEALRNLLDDLLARRYTPVVYIHTDIIPEEGTHCDELNCPRDVIQLSKAYPDFRFVIAHCGRWCEATRRGIARVDNVFIDTSIAPLFLVRKNLSIVGSRRVVFGSDYPYSHPRIEIEKVLLLGLPDRDTEAILADNFERLVS